MLYVRFTVGFFPVLYLFIFVLFLLFLFLLLFFCLSSLLFVHRIDLALLMVCVFFCTYHNHTVNLNRIILMHVVRFLRFLFQTYFTNFHTFVLHFAYERLQLHYLKQPFQSQDTIKIINDETTEKVVMKTHFFWEVLLFQLLHRCIFSFEIAVWLMRIASCK